ncbi:S8 family serine peptidase [Protaetiibacter intestinalis]|uniref:VWA domain-containing protein n=1 Tax=Protaetiibacter intestinalis TaxID=2419774 RepID=A0A387B862_9MICO|nr:S8 family serine peptidase [Protaetiibacter intestinalis]AYF97286.1 VWA domain-containing protein [Protaetiibacter intestinalis]
MSATAFRPLSAQVTTPDGSPVAGAAVTRTAPDRTTLTVETDARGIARFDADPREAASLTAIAKGLAPDAREIGDGYPVRPDGVEQFVLAPAGWPAYYRGRVRVPFRPVPDAVGVRLVGGAAPKDDAGYDGLDAIGDARDVIRFGDPTVAVVRLAAPAGGDTVRDIGREVADVDRLGEVGAVVELTDRGAAFLTDELVVSLLTDDVDPVALAARHGLEVVKRFEALPRTYVLRSPAGAGYDLLDILAAVVAEPGVRYAEPNLVVTVEDDAVTPNDFLFPQQWDHGVIGTPDAWQVLQDLDPAHTFGSPDVTIAVVDSGVDDGHPGMAVTLSDGTAKVSRLFDFARMAADNDNTADGDHGTNCAGTAAGAVNNAEGTAGVAGNCHVFGIRRSGPETRYAEMYLWLAGLDANSSTAGFPAQLATGVDVITNSFGFSIGMPISALMQDTFDAVTDDGRGGLGTALFFSAGNNIRDLDATSDRPWSMYGRCFGVAASTLDTDGVTEIHAGYSNFGSTIDFAAPSHTRFRSPDPAIRHDPNTEFGIFSSTRADAPEGTAIAGSADATTTLSAASAAGATSLSVASTAGATVGGALLVGNVATRAARGRTITAVDAGAGTVSFDFPLTTGFASGTAVAFAPRRYRSDFGGTSHATPLTAGVAALMLSANPQLRWDQVGQILRDTAVKIDPTQTDPVGRWTDVNGLVSSDPGYAGPSFSRWFGAGRIDAGAAVSRAACTIDLVTDELAFTDIPEGEEAWRAVRFDVHSLYASTFTVTGAPAAPFGLPLGATESLTGTADYQTVQEAYLWVNFVGTTAGATAAGSITVRHDQTGQEWTLQIAANTVPPTSACVMLVLDRSGSMDAASGVGTAKRIDVLHYSAGILAEAVHEGDGVGIVGFDDDSFPVLVPPVGPLLAPTIFDTTRGDVRSKISSYAVNLNGATSIGDGLELGQNELNPVGGYDTKATIVFTDGYENRNAFIADVSGSITDRTYAVALGRAENIKPAALTAVTKGTGGYCVLTDDLDADSRYKLAKYFLQVLAGVKNDQIVVDPPVKIPVGSDVDVPFVLAETDFVADVFLLTQHPELVDMTLITPDGDVIDPAFMAGLGGRNYVRVADDVVYYRLTLPAPIGAGARSGTWLARFTIDKRHLKAAVGKEQLTAEEVREIARRGLPGTVLVHASSSLRMRVDTEQDSLEPGAKARLVAWLTEYDVPVSGRAQVRATVTEPSGAQYDVDLTESAPGEFVEAIGLGAPGVYTVLFRAEGKTFRGTPFTREEVRTLSVWRGGDEYKPTEGEEPGRKRIPGRWWKAIERDPKLLELLTKRLAEDGLSVKELEREFERV